MEEMQSKISRAAKLYDDMIENHRNLMDDPKDIDQADRLLDAMMDLFDMGLPNPFRSIDESSFSVNAAIRPSKENKIVTGVKE